MTKPFCFFVLEVEVETLANFAELVPCNCLRLLSDASLSHSCHLQISRGNGPTAGNPVPVASPRHVALLMVARLDGLDRGRARRIWFLEKTRRARDEAASAAATVVEVLADPVRLTAAI